MLKFWSAKEALVYIFKTLYKKGKNSCVSNHQVLLYFIFVNEPRKTSEMKMAMNQGHGSHNILTKENITMDPEMKNTKYT